MESFSKFDRSFTDVPQRDVTHQCKFGDLRHQPCHWGTARKGELAVAKSPQRVFLQARGRVDREAYVVKEQRAASDSEEIDVYHEAYATLALRCDYVPK